MKSQTEALRDVIAERERQVSAEGWTPEHDDTHVNGEMAAAAACYAMQSCTATRQPYLLVESETTTARLPALWPWDRSWWKPKGRGFRGHRRFNGEIVWNERGQR